MSRLAGRITNLERAARNNIPYVAMVNWQVCYPSSQQPPPGTQKYHRVTLGDGRLLESVDGETAGQLQLRATETDTQPKPNGFYWVVTDYVKEGANVEA